MVLLCESRWPEFNSSTYKVAHTINNSRDYNALFWLPQASDTCGGAQTYLQHTWKKTTYNHQINYLTNFYNFIKFDS